MGLIQLQMTDLSVSSDWWKKLVKHFACIGDELEIRCWKEETLEIKQASLYGTPLEDGFEVAVKGTVTDEFLTELLTEAPADKAIYNKMTKYFTIRMKNKAFDFDSEHYGTEIYIHGASDHDIAFFSKTIAQYANCFSIQIEA